MATDDPPSQHPQSPPSSDPATPRPLTIDDVPRLGSGTGIAIGCTLVVIGFVVLFWFVRGWFMPGH